MKPHKSIPKFKSEEEEAVFWKTHSLADYPEELKEARNIEFPRPRKRLVSMRIDDSMIHAIKEIASTKGIGYLTLIRLWVAERLSRERRLFHTRHG